MNQSPEITLGYSEGEPCGRDGCPGIIEERPVENCSCHINPPCGACTSPRHYCEECDWEEADDPLVVQAEGAIHLYSNGGAFVEHYRRVLDPTKIDYTISMHSSSSQKVTGVYPPGTTQAEVRERVDGTFGGRFERFGNGHFTFIAYTD